MDINAMRNLRHVHTQIRKTLPLDYVQAFFDVSDILRQLVEDRADKAARSALDERVGTEVSELLLTSAIILSRSHFCYPQSTSDYSNVVGCSYFDYLEKGGRKAVYQQ
jgi:hypothetical protein